MKPWLSYRPCPLCGSLASSTRLHPKGTLRCQLRERSRERIHKIYVGCRYEWAEVPAETGAPTRLSA
jgi:hypothetical protein